MIDHPYAQLRRLRARLRRRGAEAYGRRAAGEAPRHATLPLELEPLDRDLSPFTGLTRATWRRIAERLLENVLQYTGAMREPLTLPPSRAAGYPYLDLAGRARRVREAYLEGYARTLLLASALLADEPGLELHGRGVGDYYREYLARGVHPSDPASFGRTTTPRADQRTVEAGLIALALRTAPEALWEPLEARDRARALDWLEHLSRRAVPRNNWHWFNVLLQTFLALEGRGADDERIERHLGALGAMYVDAGWFRDGAAFDFYCGWAMQTFPLVWAAWDGDRFPKRRDELLRRNDEFLGGYPHVFARRGAMPAWGRSQCYRFAASAPLALAFVRPDAPAIDPGFARRVCSGNLLQFLERPGVLVDGVLSLGFYEEDPAVVDGYSCVGSPYWASLLFLALALSESSAFWTAVENEGFWAEPPASVRFGTTGLSAEHDAESGRTRLFAPQATRAGDHRYRQPFFEAV